MDGDEVPTFASSDEELKYWKDQALQYRKGMLEAREELEEFQEHSRELEQELEMQLEQADKRGQELRNLNSRLQTDNETYKDRIEQMHHEFSSQINMLQTELTSHRERDVKCMTYIRELEQRNDDLERSQRVTVASVEDFELKLNSALERNAFLESELDEKESLRTMVQRLKDEARDLKQELKIRERQTPDLENKKNLELMRTSMECSKIIKFDTPNNITSSPLKLSYQNGTNSPAMTPSARISALNIVGDLLRGVSSLEGKVAHARTLPREPAVDSPRTLNTPNRFRRVNSRPTSVTSAAASASPSAASAASTNGTSSPLIRA